MKHDSGKEVDKIGVDSKYEGIKILERALFFKYYIVIKRKIAKKNEF